MFFVKEIGLVQAEGKNIYFSQRTFCSIAADPGSDLDNTLNELILSPGQPVIADGDESSEFINYLIQLGFLSKGDSTSGKGDCSATAFHKKVSVRSRPSVHLLLTQYCNLKCSYCYNGSDSYQLKNKLRMSAPHAEASLRLFSRYALKGGHIAINFLGGEPLLNWDTASHILRHHKEIAREEGFFGTFGFSVQTNLTFLPDKFLDDAKEHDLTIVVEVDGPEEIHNSHRPHGSQLSNSFKLTKENCRILLENGIKFECKSVITAKNLEIIDDLQDLHRSLGADSSAFGFVRPVDSDSYRFDKDLLPRWGEISERLNISRERKGSFWRKTLQNFTEALEGEKVCGTAGCYATHASIFTVTSDGRIYGCPWFVSDPTHYIGSINDAQIDPSKAMESAKALERVRSDECSNCDFYFACGGPCPVTSALCKDDPDLVREVRLSKCAQTKSAGIAILLERLNRP